MSTTTATITRRNRDRRHGHGGRVRHCREFDRELGPLNCAPVQAVKTFDKRFGRISYQQGLACCAVQYPLDIPPR